MKISNIVEQKALPSFCTANFDVIESIFYFCNLNKLPCLIECTSNQVNQYGGYSKNTPKTFVKKINNLRKKIKLKQSQLFLGGDHLGPLPWKNKSNKIAIANSIILINKFINEKFHKIHIDTSIKCKNDKFLNNKIIFNRTSRVINSLNSKDKINDLFLIFGTEVPQAGSGNSRNISITKLKNIKSDSANFIKLLKKHNFTKKSFGLVIEPGMKYMNYSIKKPLFKNFFKKKKISKKYKFVYEAHSTDYQPKKILDKLVDNNFKFLKVGPELTYNYSRALFFMNNVEKKFFKKTVSDIKKNILLAMLKNKKYWKDYYYNKKEQLLLNSKLDRSRYYLNTKNVKNSIDVLKRNINQLDKYKFLSLLKRGSREDFLKNNKKKLSNFDNIKLIFISKTLKRYYKACKFVNIE